MKEKYKCKTYHKQLENYMKWYFKSLDERNRRRYWATEAIKLWFWWQTYIQDLLWISNMTMKKWIDEVKGEQEYERIRWTWWWRKKVIDKHTDIWKDFEDIMKNHTAWDPMNPDVKRTDLTPTEISQKFKDKGKNYVSIYIAKQLLKAKKYRKRKNIKNKSMWSVENRNEQFENIEKKINQAVKDKAWIFSIDTKKKKS